VIGFVLFLMVMLTGQQLKSDSEILFTPAKGHGMTKLKPPKLHNKAK